MNLCHFIINSYDYMLCLPSSCGYKFRVNFLERIYVICELLHINFYIKICIENFFVMSNIFVKVH